MESRRGERDSWRLTNQRGGKKRLRWDPRKVAAYFSAVFDHHHHSEDQAGTLWVLPMHYWGPTIQWGGGFLRNHRWNLSNWKSIYVLFVLLLFSFINYWIVNDPLTNWLMQNYILQQIIQYHHPSDCSLLCCCGHLTSDYSAPDTKKNQEPDADDDDWWWLVCAADCVADCAADNREPEADGDDWWWPVCAKVEGGCGGFSVILLQELESPQQLPVININCYH